VSFTLRAMAAEDIDPLLMLAGDSVDAPQWTRRDYEQILLASPSGLLRRYGPVACSGDRLTGFAVASWLRHEAAAEVEGLMVERDHRRQGIGTALIGACMAWAAGTGASAIRLEVRASNVAALALYRRLGFSTAGVRRAYYSAPVEDALLLQAPLVPQSPL
jgi:[ribosomal protein S18]-alanine N-acetyltransferase